MPKETKDQTSTENLSFEQAFEQLTQIVQKLEAGEGTLTDRTTLFEQGVQLSKHCSGELDAIEQKVEILIKGDSTPQPFDTPPID